jgi:CRISPR/Cas system-associated exonuclease Cas4 (RecB family)
LIPSVEEEIIDPALNVKGFIDAVHDDEEGVIIMDYKTSNKEEITVEYKLQLGIYALLYKSKYSKTPAKVGVNFLKYGEQTIDVDDVLLEHAKKEILFVHEMTSSDKVADYPRKEGPLCKWSSGKCDYYEKCFEQKNA